MYYQLLSSLNRNLNNLKKFHSKFIKKNILDKWLIKIKLRRSGICHAHDKTKQTRHTNTLLHYLYYCNNKYYLEINQLSMIYIL